MVPSDRKLREFLLAQSPVWLTDRLLDASASDPALLATLRAAAAGSDRAQVVRRELDRVLWVGEGVDWAREIPTRACVEGNPDPAALAQRLFTLAVADDWGVFTDVVAIRRSRRGSRRAARRGRRAVPRRPRPARKETGAGSRHRDRARTAARPLLVPRRGRRRAGPRTSPARRLRARGRRRTCQCVLGHRVEWRSLGRLSDRQITMVVPFSAGGPTDTVTRLIAEPMSAKLGQQIVVQNVEGAGGTIGAGQVARATPDGYETA